MNAFLGRWGLLLAMGLVALVHAGALDSGFHFDDEHSLLGNPHLRDLANLPAFFVDPQLFSRNPGSEMYRPLVLVSYALNYRFGGYDRFGFHLVNLILHLLVTLLVYRVLARAGLEARLALAGALLFGVHPLTAEPVNYVNARSESLAALFVLGSLLLYLRSRQTIPWGSALCLAAGLLAKATAAVLPLLLLLWERVLNRRSWKECGQRQWLHWVTMLGYLWGTSRLISEALVEAPVRSWNAQFSTQVKALVYYAKLLVLPYPLAIEHQFFVSTSWLEGEVLVSLALLGSLGMALLCTRRRDFRFWAGWMVLCLLPTLVVPLNVLVSERRLYLPLVGGVGLGFSLGSQAAWKKRGWISAGLLLLLLAAMTAQQSQVWESEERLWEQARDRAPLMARPYLRLGSLHRQQGRLSLAEAEFRQALERDPQSAPAYNNLGNLYALRGEIEAAEQAYGQALKLLPFYPEALINLATLYSDQGRFAEALECYGKALPLSRNREEIYNNLGTTYLKMGQFSEAEQALRQALKLNPEKAGIYFNLGGALERQGRAAEALAAYQRAVSLDSSHAKAYYRLGFLCEQQGLSKDAAQAYENFLRLWKGDPRFAQEVRQHLRELAPEVR